MSAGTGCSPALMPAHGQPVRAGVRAFGDCEISWQKQKFLARIQRCETLDGRMDVEVYSVLGQPLLVLTIDKDSVRIDAGGERADAGYHDPISTVHFFKDYPFTFDALFRIIAGSVELLVPAMAPPDSAWLNSGLECRLWQSGGMNITSSMRGKKMHEILIRPDTGSDEWKVTLRDFVDGFARLVCFENQAGNYFTIRYRTIRQISDLQDCH